MGPRLANRSLQLYVLTPSFPPTLGGQENHLLDLCASLTAAGAGVLVITRRLTPGVPAEEVLRSVTVRRLTPHGAIKGVGFRAVPRLGALLTKMIWQLIRERRRYDVVLVSGFNVMPMAPVLAAIITGKPCVVRPESPLEVSESVGAESRSKMGLSEKSAAIRLLTALRRRVASRVDRYVTISAEIAAELRQVGIEPRRIVAIPNGIDVERFAPVTAGRKLQLRRQLGVPTDALLMIYTGRLAISKGVMTLIDVWRELAPANLTAHLLMVGTGQDCFDDCETDLRSFIEANKMTDRVTLTGAVSNVHEYLQSSDLFVFCSDYEGFSLSILEAMTAGLPLVSTRVGIAAELEQKNADRFAELVPPKDRGQFRDALQKTLADPASRRRMGTNARAAVQAEYSLPAEAKRYMALFDELTESNS